MRYAVLTNTVSCRAVSEDYVPDIGEVIFEGELSDSVVWDENLQNLRVKNQEEILNGIRILKITSLKTDCTNAIQAGFVSNALGSAHTYDSSLPQDQTNLLGAKLAGIDQPYTCTDSNGSKAQRFHTFAQIEQVFLAGMLHVQAAKSHFYACVAAVNQAETIEAVELVNW